ncbi:MAG: NAD-dependent epimerase/dehydratase family protein [Rhizobiaceae bacterium]
MFKPETPSIYFVTGGSGYVGRNIVRWLVSKGHEVRALVRSQKSATIVTDLGAKAVLGDMSDREILQKGMAGAQYLIHAAANTDHGIISEAAEQENEIATDNVYQAAKEVGIVRCLHLSTEAVLLDGNPLVMATEALPYPNKSAGGYSKTKAEAERIAFSCSGEKMEVVALRPRFIWGRDDTTALPQLIKAAKTGKLSWIDGGMYLTSTTHIANVVHGIMLALENGRAGEAYFISDGDPVVFRQFVSDLLATKKVEAPKGSIPRWLVASVVRIGDLLSRLTRGKINGPMSQQEYATLGFEVTLDINKAQKELGYKPIISMKEGMAELSQPKI